MQNYSEINVFEKLRIWYVMSLKKSLFPVDFEGAKPPEIITKNNSQGIIFVIISCQRVSTFLVMEWCFRYSETPLSPVSWHSMGLQQHRTQTASKKWTFLAPPPFCFCLGGFFLSFSFGRRDRLRPHWRRRCFDVVTWAVKQSEKSPRPQR